MRHTVRWLLVAWVLAGCIDEVELGNTGDLGTGGFIHDPVGQAGDAGAAGQGGSGTGGRVDVPPCPGVAYEPGLDASGNVCAAMRAETEPALLDVYIMMDRTSSMENTVAPDVTRWSALTQAVESFVVDARAQQIRAGLQFFGLSGGLNDEADCDVAGYRSPTVEIGPLSEVGQAIVDAMHAIALGGQTPTVPALQGAIEHAQQWAIANPGRRSTVLLVTDGLPTSCDTDLLSLEAVARQGVINDPPILTFVLGVSAGAAEYNLHRIAKAGGTHEAFLTQDDDYTTSLVNGLLKVAETSLSCQYRVPEPLNAGEIVDPEQVQVVYTDPGGAEEIPRVSSQRACNSQHGGWYYDNPAAPTQIIACPCTCSNFGSGAVEIYVGCTPVIM